MKSIVLLSSGLDSTVNLLMALQKGDVVQALTFDYGQRAFEKELQYSTELCVEHSVPHKVITLDFMKSITKTSLVNTEADVPTGTDVDIASQATSESTADRVWVPNRNGLFLNIGAAFAESLEATHVIAGFNKEEAATFPDNSREFMEVSSKSFMYSTRGEVQCVSLTIDMNKTEILSEGLKLGLDTQKIWPCYFSGETLCGQCESCLRFENARNQL